MMDQFNEQLSELDNRLRKGLSLGKDLKFEMKIRDSAHSLGRKASEHQGDLLDLKAEVVSLKNRLFTADQKRMEDVGLK